MRDPYLQFGPFRVHPTQGLAKHGREIRVTPKSLSVLIALARRKGRIVTKEELFASVWTGRFVADSTLSSCIRELRVALGDDARNPRYIETVHRRGFRLLTDGHDDAIVGDTARNQAWKIDAADAEHAQALQGLNRVAESVRNGSPRMAVLSGGGIGQAAVADEFFAGLADQSDWLICRTGCADPSDAGDAYGPLIQMAGQLASGSADARTARVLGRFAPTWSAELSAIRNESSSDILNLRVSGATSTRRHRELREAIEALTDTTVLAIGLDNIDWCDAETLNWLTAFLCDPGNASVLIVATCEEIPAVDSALTDCLAGLCESAAVEMLELGPSGRDQVSRRIKRCVAQELQRLTAGDRNLLDAASVAGVTFTTEELAAATGLTADDITPVLESLLRITGLASLHQHESWPDGTETRRYAFDHVQLREEVLARVPVPERARMHRCIAQRLADGWRGNLAPIASRLAAHFEDAGAIKRAVTCWYEAGANARRRGSQAVALRNFRRALALLESLPKTADRHLLEAKLQSCIGRELVFCHGLDAQKVIDCFELADQRRRGLPPSPELCHVMLQIWMFYLSRGPLRMAMEIAQELDELGRQLDDPALQLQAHHSCWVTALSLCDVAAILHHSRKGMAICGSGTSGSLVMTSGCTFHDVHLNDHPAAVCAGFAGAWADILRDSKSSAVMSIDAAISHARVIEHPFTLAVTLTMAAGALAAAADAASTRLRAAEGRSIAERHGFGGVYAWAAVYEGWAMAKLGDTAEGLELLKAGLATTKASGISLFRPFHLSLEAGAKLQGGLSDEAGGCLEEAFAISARSGNRLGLSEMHRLRAELRLKRDGAKGREQAIADLESAIDIAHAQGASLWESRAIQRRAEVTGSTAATPRRGPRRPFRLVE